MVDPRRKAIQSESTAIAHVRALTEEGDKAQKTRRTAEAAAVNTNAAGTPPRLCEAPLVLVPVPLGATDDEAIEGSWTRERQHFSLSAKGIIRTLLLVLLDAEAALTWSPVACEGIAVPATVALCMLVLGVSKGASGKASQEGVGASNAWNNGLPNCGTACTTRDALAMCGGRG